MSMIPDDLKSIHADALKWPNDAIGSAPYYHSMLVRHYNGMLVRLIERIGSVENENAQLKEQLEREKCQGGACLDREELQFLRGAIANCGVVFEHRVIDGVACEIIVNQRAEKAEAQVERLSAPVSFDEFDAHSVAGNSLVRGIDIVSARAIIAARAGGK